MTTPWLCPRDHTCPNVTSHDSYSAHKYGCRSGAAIADRHRYEKLTNAGLYPYQVYPAGPYARRLQALAARGWRDEDIAARSGAGVTSSFVGRIRRGRGAYVHRGTARWVQRVFLELRYQQGPSELCRIRAERRGDVPEACWDDIDNMDERPKRGKGSSGSTGHRGQVLDRRARCVRLAAEGKSLQQIAWDVGIVERTVSRHLAAAHEERLLQAASLPVEIIERAVGDTGEAEVA